MTTQNTAAVVLNAAELPLESFADSTFGTVKWNTLFTADRTQTAQMTCGLAHFAPGESLELHRHAQAEVYFGVTGTGRVIVDGVEHMLAPGVAIYIPGGAVHGAFADAEAMSFFYVFPTDSFAEIEYQLPVAFEPLEPVAAANIDNAPHPELEIIGEQFDILDQTAVTDMQVQ